MKLIISSVSGEPIYEQIKNQIRSAVMSGEQTAQDGRIITGQAAGASIAFGLKLVEALRGVPFRREDVRRVLDSQPMSELFGGITEEQVLDTMFGS